MTESTSVWTAVIAFPSFQIPTNVRRARTPAFPNLLKFGDTFGISQSMPPFSLLVRSSLKLPCYPSAILPRPGIQGDPRIGPGSCGGFQCHRQPFRTLGFTQNEVTRDVLTGLAQTLPIDSQYWQLTRVACD